MQISWVTLDRLCQQQAGADPVIGRMLTRSGRPLRSNAEQLTDADLLDKLRSFGIDLDREGLSKLCEGALSAEEVACELLDSHGLGDDVEADWIWISLVTLWQRWWPDRVCLEFLDDKVQAGYDEGERPRPPRPRYGSMPGLTCCVSSVCFRWSGPVVICFGCMT